MRFFRIIWDGITKENQVFKAALGLCPTLAVSTSVENAIGMGVAATLVLIGSNFVVSLIRNWVPKQVRIPIFIVVIATFVTAVDLTMHAYFPALHEKLGIFVPLIVVNCIILGRAEAFASKNNPFYSIADGIGIGIGFMLGLMLLATFREVLGAGTFLGKSLGIKEPALIMILPPGAFLTIGFLMAFFNWAGGDK